MAFIKLPEELLDADITAAQFRILANLIKYSFDDGHSYIGYTKLAEVCFTNKSFIIKSIKELEKKGFIQVTHRGTFSRSNDIKLTFENGIKNFRKSGGDYSGKSPKGCLNSTPKGCLNDTPRGCLNDTHGCLNDTPYKDKRFKYQDLNLNTREEGCLNDTPRVNSKYIESNDVTFDKTMPDGGQAAGSSASNQIGSEFGENDKKITAFINRKYPNFKAWYTLSRDVHGSYFINPITSFVRRIIPNSDVVTLAPDGVSVCSYPANEMRGNFVKII